MMEVQIVHYIQDHGFNDRYNQISGPKLHFKTFKYGPTRDYKIIRQGASMSIEYYHHRWHHITGLLPIKGLLNMYYGDIKGETCGIWVDPDGMHFSIAIK